ncbi:MAG TPA: ATP synthase F1 subunit delta [Gemmatimonadales bacterium]|jgi:F-type H+-transporting ATPase subunit delta|nr:ATP synthase F1 subunit delta [Gemmatimonadales bacterium]
MRSVTIARNYAEALVALADKGPGSDEDWGTLIDATSAAMMAPAVEAALMSPRVPRDRKVAIVSAAHASAPRPYVLFLAAVIRRGRQMLLPQIADEYRALVDIKLNRVRASVVMARDVDALTRSVLVDQLARAIGKSIIAGFSTDPALLGGVVVRIGDRVYDGSARKRLAVLRQRLLAG